MRWVEGEVSREKGLEGSGGQRRQEGEQDGHGDGESDRDGPTKTESHQ